MSNDTELYIDLAIVATSFISGVCRFKRLDTAGKLLLLLLAAMFFDEVVAHIYALKYHNNIRVYNIYSIIEFAIMALYFNYSVDAFRKKGVGYYILVAGLIFAIVNYSFIQPINTFNSFYLFFEGFTVVTLALIAFYRMLMYNEDLKLYTYHHFWFTAIFLFFWSITFLSWGMFPMFKNKEIIKQMILFIWVANVISYGAVGLIFLLYPKMKTANE